MEISSPESNTFFGKKPTSFWVVEWLQIKELSTDYTEFKSSNIKSPDPCSFSYSAKISSTCGLDIKITKKTSKIAKANITVSFIDMSVDKMIKMDEWKDEECDFLNIIKGDALQSLDRVHVMILNVWFGFLDDVPPAPISKQVCPGSEYFYLNEELSDFDIVIGDAVLPVHKFLLAASSREFLKMFTTPMRESQENRVIIEDIELPVMKEVLRYIYTKETILISDIEMALKVLIVAEKYGLDSLKQTCQNKLYKQLNLDNALMILDIADMYNAQQLKKSTIVFLNEHKKDIANRSDFKDLYHRKPELLFDFITLALGN